MKSIYNKLFFLLFFISCFIIIVSPNKIFGSSKGYTIKSYNVDINVNESNSFDVIETITANFLEEKHGIIRKIPTTNSIVRNDGSTAKNRAIISKIEVSDPYTKSSSSGYTSLKIGSAANTLLGEHTYTIKYKYSIYGIDGLKDADEFYFNLIGTEWDTSIEKASFKVTMPKEFDTSLLGFSSGNKGSKDSSNVQYSIDGNVIIGNIKHSLEAYQGVTIRLTLPDEYFFNIVNVFEKIINFIIAHYMQIILAISVIFLLRAFILWIKYGKDEQVIETVEFYPPKGYNSAEIGYMYNGKATDEAVISTLIQLANKGYIKIEEIENKGVLKKKPFKIIKLNKYEEIDYVEKTFFNGLFKNGEPDHEVIESYIRETEQKGEKITKRKLKMLKRNLPIKEVTEKDLKNKFYLTINSIKRHLDNSRDKIYEKNDTRQSKIKSSINKVCFFALCNIFIQSDISILYKVLTVFALQMSITKLIKIAFFYRIKTVGDIISFIIFSGISIYFTKNNLYPIINQNVEVRNFYIAVLFIIFALAILGILMEKRTNYGTKILGQIKGFRSFLENAEKGQLEALVEKNPEYFYEILPYTYALGVSKKWIKQFETIAVRPPNWYNSSYSTFNTTDFTKIIDDTVRDVSDSMRFGERGYKEERPESLLAQILTSDSDSSSWSSSSSSDSSSSSSSSGGGSSGGGSGGRRRQLLVIYK